MVKSGARTQQLLRERATRQRALQVWLGLAIIWAVLLGWVVFAFVGTVTDGSDGRIAWLAYLVPLIVLAIGTLVTYLGVRRTGAALVALAEQSRTK
jgi:uncharacterized membrane protein YhdT